MLSQLVDLLVYTLQSPREGDGGGDGGGEGGGGGGGGGDGDGGDGGHSLAHLSQAAPAGMYLGKDQHKAY